MCDRDASRTNREIRYRGWFKRGSIPREGTTKHKGPFFGDGVPAAAGHLTLGALRACATPRKRGLYVLIDTFHEESNGRNTSQGIVYPVKKRVAVFRSLDKHFQR